ncbi:MAG: 23S rRNA (uracil(1939)-C(5))-methyltransferase RlmD [Oscillospiraceae bacterium]|nr:23S rRNA (uracil(1939)-C(5))-methyltransferase RlmD [Oscillospiraceae bacterium]
MPKPNQTAAGHPVCPLAKKCGGCQLQNLRYEEQLHFKQAKEIRLLGRFCHVEEILGMEHPYHYRNKVQAAFGRNRQGQIISGVYQSASHRIVPVSDCMIEDPVADRIIGTIRDLMRSFKIQPYDEDTGRGTLRHVLVKRGFRSGQVMVVLVTGRSMLPGKRNFVKALLERHPEITTIVHNVNGGQTSLVLGAHSEVLYGPGTIDEQLGEFTFRISPRAFYQINPVQTEVLYGKALEFAGLTGTETVIDAYCGTGTIGIFASRSAKEVIGVENNRDAVRDAIRNAKQNHAGNVRFYTADAGEFLQGMALSGERADVVILDPPRAGSDKRFLSSLCRLAPQRIVYVSCNPETLARDLDDLTAHGYRVTKIQPVDMFPHTEHIETVVQLQKAAGRRI